VLCCVVLCCVVLCCVVLCCVVLCCVVLCCFVLCCVVLCCVVLCCVVLCFVVLCCVVLCCVVLCRVVLCCVVLCCVVLCCVVLCCVVLCCVVLCCVVLCCVVQHTLNPFEPLLSRNCFAQRLHGRLVHCVRHHCGTGEPLTVPPLALSPFLVVVPRVALVHNESAPPFVWTLKQYVDIPVQPRLIVAVVVGACVSVSVCV
jgi:hypothetical protein